MDNSHVVCIETCLGETWSLLYLNACVLFMYLSIFLKKKLAFLVLSGNFPMSACGQITQQRKWNMKKKNFKIFVHCAVNVYDIHFNFAIFLH